MQRMHPWLLPFLRKALVILFLRLKKKEIWGTHKEFHFTVIVILFLRYTLLVLG